MPFQDLQRKDSKFQMKTVCLFILGTVFILSTMTKDFLITLENGKELLAQSDIDGQDIEEEKVNKIAKKTEKKTTGRDTIGDKFFRRLSKKVSSDYYFSETKQKKAKEIGKGIFLDQGGTLWECRFRKNKR